MMSPSGPTELRACCTNSSFFFIPARPSAGPYYLHRTGRFVHHLADFHRSLGSEPLRIARSSARSESCALRHAGCELEASSGRNRNVTVHPNGNLTLQTTNGARYGL